MINGRPLYRHTLRIGTYMQDSLHSCLVSSTKTANKTALIWYVNTVNYIAGNEKGQQRNS